MNKLKLAITALLVGVFGFAIPASAMAHNGVDDGDGEDDSSLSSKKQELIDKYKKEAREKNEAAKATVTEKTTEARQKACTAKKDNVEKRIQSKKDLATKHKESFDKIFARVKTFHDSKNLNTENYDALVEAVETAEANVDTQIAALNSLDSNVYCTDPGVANSISTFRESITSTREALKSYKTALLDLIKAVKQSAKSSQGDN